MFRQAVLVALADVEDRDTLLNERGMEVRVQLVQTEVYHPRASNIEFRVPVSPIITAHLPLEASSAALVVPVVSSPISSVSPYAV